VRGFSLGMRQRLGLAAALLTGPRLLVLDEPANGLDPAGTRHVHRVLTGLAARGTSIVLSIHRMDDLAALCSEVTGVDEKGDRLRPSFGWLRERSRHATHARPASERRTPLWWSGPGAPLRLGCAGVFGTGGRRDARATVRSARGAGRAPRERVLQHLPSRGL
jgi:energy-coupling factor transporter ATP-binding protein EcfA2